VAGAGAGAVAGALTESEPFAQLPLLPLASRGWPPTGTLGLMVNGVL
jgi:hypothetical protein